MQDLLASRAKQAADKKKRAELAAVEADLGEEGRVGHANMPATSPEPDLPLPEPVEQSVETRVREPHDVDFIGVCSTCD